MPLEVVQFVVVPAVVGYAVSAWFRMRDARRSLVAFHAAFRVGMGVGAAVARDAAGDDEVRRRIDAPVLRVLERSDDAHEAVVAGDMATVYAIARGFRD